MRILLASAKYKCVYRQHSKMLAWYAYFHGEIVGFSDFLLCLSRAQVPSLHVSLWHIWQFVQVYMRVPKRCSLARILGEKDSNTTPATTCGSLSAHKNRSRDSESVRCQLMITSVSLCHCLAGSLLHPQLHLHRQAALPSSAPLSDLIMTIHSCHNVS